MDSVESRLYKVVMGVDGIHMYKTIYVTDFQKRDDKIYAFLYVIGKRDDVWGFPDYEEKCEIEEDLHRALDEGGFDILYEVDTEIDTILIVKPK